MKIVCPECQAAYEIDIPDSPAKDLSAKCAACHAKFPIKKESLAESNHAHDSMAGPHLAQIDSGFSEESNDDFLSGLQEDLKGFEGMDRLPEESIDDKNLDDYLNRLMEEDLDEPDKEILPASEDPPPATDSAPTASPMPSEDELDDLFNSLIEEEIKSPEKEEDITAAPENSQENEEDLDALLDEIILNNLEDEAKPEPPTNKIEDTDESVTDPIEKPGSAVESSEPENLSSESTDDENAEEDILAKALSEESPLSELSLGENSEEISEDPQEVTDSIPTVEQPEEEKEDEDLRAEAFADQEAVKEDAEKETVAEQPEEEKSDEDLWAEAFADQEAVKEDAEKETVVEQPEEEKSDEDLWAEAFADQEAVKEDAEKETVAEQPEEEKSDPEEGEEKSDEISEADDPDREMTAEEIVAADTAKELDEEAHADEDEDLAEETVDNEFGISESDYDDDEYGDDEEEFSISEKKKSFFSLPTSRTGKLVLGGGVLAVLLSAGGAYFALQTLAPSELTEMSKNPSKVPEGLQPKDSKENTALQDQPGQNGSSEPNPALTAALGTEEPPSPAGDAENPKSKDPLLEAVSSSSLSQGLVAALAPGNHAVQLATIMPVAYNINDIRVLSFNLEAEMSDAKSAQVIREAMPVFEKITVTTVEQLMDKKFFNDILYVREKLKKNLQNNFNKTLEGGGRVKKITFKEFTVQ